VRGQSRVLPRFSNPLAHMHALLSVKSNLAFFIYKGSSDSQWVQEKRIKLMLGFTETKCP
jgi:hypothetical protein